MCECANAGMREEPLARVNQKTGNIQSFVIKDFTAKTAKRLHGYLIRLTREYTDGGMDRRADEYEFHYSRIFYKWDIDSIKKISYSFSFIQTSDCCARIILAAVTFREWTERVGP